MFPPRLLTVLTFIASLCFVCGAPEAPSIYGIHDTSPLPSEFLTPVETRARGGWLTATVAVGHNPNDTSGQSFFTFTNSGHTVICRLNNGYFPDGTIPLPADYDNFARRCSNFVMNSSGCNIWVIGNELNLQGEWPFDGTKFAYVSPQQYAICFRKVYNAIKAVRPNDRVLPAPPAPFAGPYGAGTQNGYPADGNPLNWTTYLNQQLSTIASSGPLDGIALHINSRGYAYSDIHSTSRINAGGTQLYFSFYVYKDWVDKGIPVSLYHLPLYATECNGYYYWKGGHPENTAKHYEPGWMQEIYGEIDRYNRLAAGQGKPAFRCVNMYRWCACDGWNIDGSDNPYKPQILADLNAATAQNYRWPAGSENRTNLVSAGAVWRYLDNGSDQGTAWRGTNFNDTAWTQGRAQLGYGDGDEATVVCCSNAVSKSITTYFRRAITVPDATFYTNLALRLVRDDGAVVYLNGTEIHRDNMPGGTITSATRALAAVSGTDEATFYAAAVSPALLRNGTNVLAVEIHQSETNSSDISFDLELIGRGNAAPTVTIIEPATGSIIGAPTNLLVSAMAQDDYAITQLEWLLNGVTVALQSAPPFSVTLSNLAPGSYTLRAIARDGVLSATSAPVTVSLQASLVRKGAAWRYVDDGSDRGTSWRLPGFNDAAWQTGLAQFGFGGQGEVTPLNFGDDANKYVTYYFRGPFIAPAARTNLMIRLLRDDGAVIYINGAEILRSNMPATNPITYLTLAATTVGGSDETTFFTSIVPATNVVTGTNLIAVELHQAQRTSGDVSFDLEMLALAPPPAARVRAEVSGTNPRVSWPGGAGTFVLQSASTLAEPIPWQNWTGGVMFDGSSFTIVPGMAETNRFFRLIRAGN